jgi:hypothetical protein
MKLTGTVLVYPSLAVTTPSTVIASALVLNNSKQMAEQKTPIKGRTGFMTFVGIAVRLLMRTVVVFLWIKFTAPS